MKGFHHNLNAFALCLIGIVATFIPHNALAFGDTHQLYEKNGEYYLKADPTWVPITSQITFIIPTYGPGDLVKLTESNGQWQSQSITYDAFLSANPTAVADGAVSYSDLNSDGIEDILVYLGVNSGYTQLELISNQSNSGSFIARRVASPTPLLPQSPQVASIPGEDTTSTEVGIVGGQFRVDESGSATYSVPFKLPNAPGNIKPAIGVSYSSSAGNGIMGVGWNISGLSSVSRCRPTKETFGSNKPVELNENDRFCLDGQPLVLQSGSYGGHYSTYSTEIYSGSRITLIGSTLGNPTRFEVEREDGSVWYYGESSTSRLIANGTNLNWAVTTIKDNVGNRIDFNYRKSAGTGYGYNEILIDNITYGGNSIDFIYNSAGVRGDTYTRYINGTKVEQKALLTDVVVKNHDSVSLVSYHFGYQRNEENHNSLNSQLTNLQQCEGSRSGICLPADTFTYSQPGSPGMAGNIATINLPNENDVMRSFPLDVTGDGFTDWVYAYRSGSGYYVKVYENLGVSNKTVTFSTTPVTSAFILTTGLSANDFNMLTMDVDSDGIIDLVGPRKSGSVNKWAKINANGSSADLGVPYHKNDISVDVNGDGKVDIVKEWKVYENNGGTFTEKLIRLFPLEQYLFSEYDGAPAVSGIKYLVSAPMDLDGDGNSELFARVYFGEDIQRQENFVLSLKSTSSGYSFDYMLDGGKNEQYVSGDINGDGLTDLIGRDPYDYKWRYRISNHGSQERWLNPVLQNNPDLTENPDINDADSLRILDVNGDGNVELAFLYEEGSLNKWYFYTYQDGQWQYLFDSIVPDLLSSNVSSSDLADFDGDGRLDLFVMDYRNNKRVKIRLSEKFEQQSYSKPTDKITKITNGFGVETDIEYMSMLHEDGKSIGAIYTKGAPITTTWGKGSLVADIIGPMYLVREVSTDSPGYDGTSYKSNNEVSVQYAYEGLRMQAGGRGSVGFAKLKTKDMQTNVITETTYRQDFPYVGMPKRTIMKRNSTVLDDATNTTISSKTLKAVGGISNGRAYMPYIKVSEQRQYVFNTANNTSSYFGKVKTTSTYSDKPSANSAEYFVLTNSLVDTYNKSNAHMKRVSTTNEFNAENTSGRWWINRITKSTVKHQIYSVSGHTPDTKTRIASFSYNSKGMLEKEIVGSNTNDKLYTLHCYANNGMKLRTITYSNHYASSANCSGYRPSSSSVDNDPLRVFRESRVAYNSHYHYVQKTYNGLGFLLSKASYVNKWSQPQTLRQYTDSAGSAGVVKSIRYGRFGNKYFEGDDTGKSVHTVSRLSGAASSIGAPAISESYYYVTKQTSAGSAPAFSYFDKLGRQVATVSKGFSGSNIYQYQRYDIDGRAYKASVPSYTSAGEGWSSTTYDVLGRVHQVTDGNGTKSTTSYSMNGSNRRTTSTVNYPAPSLSNRSFIKETLHNMLGELIVVDDNNNGSFQSGSGSLRNNYDATGNLVKVTNVDNVVSQTISYDSYGRKLSMSDVSKGDWTYTYNALGELATQTSPTSDKTSNYRDIVGRMAEKRTVIAGKGITESIQYTYKLGSVNYLALQEERLLENSVIKYKKLYDYDKFDRLDWTKTLIDGKYYAQQTTFDQYGRIFQQFDPLERNNVSRDGIGCFNNNGSVVGTCKGVQNHYNENGYLYKQTEAQEGLSASGNDVFYRIASMDARGNVTRAYQGSHISTINEFNTVTGLPESSLVKSGNTVIQDNDYAFDGIGNLRERLRRSLKSSNGFSNDKFGYDSQHRLTHIDNQEQVKYFGNGNIRWKRGVDNGTSRYYCYHSSNPYAVSGLGSNGCTTRSYRYDDKGNMTSGKGRNITYSHFDKATKIQKGSDYTDFFYDSKRSRFKRIDKKGNEVKETLYIGNLEIITTNGTSVMQTRRYIPGGVMNQYGNSRESYNFEHKDHLGSVNTITDGNGNIINKMAFDAWGKRFIISRSQWSSTAASKAATHVYALDSILDVTKRGYTGHEHIDNMDIIHMNGRIYDPTLGRFLQADPHIQAPTNSQSFNRYSYVLNNPLSYTDPSGYFFSKLWKKVKPFVGAIAAAVVSIYCQVCGASMWNAALTGAAVGAGSAAINGGNILKGALIGAFSGAAFHQIGASFNGEAGSGFFAEGGLGHIGAHAVTGGVASVLQGGKFGHGFISAGLTKAMNINKLIGNAAKDAGLRVATAAIVGGTISKITGGKFANGAISAAFAQAFNGEQQAKRQRTEASIKEKLMGLVDEYGDEALKIMQGVGGAAQVAIGLGTCAQTAGAGCVVAAHGVSNMMEALGVTDGNVVKKFYMDLLGDSAGKTLFYAIDIGSAGAAASARTLAPNFLKKATHTRSIHYSPTSGKSALGNTHMNFATDSYRAFMTAGGGSLAINDAIVIGNGVYNDYGK